MILLDIINKVPKDVYMIVGGLVAGVIVMGLKNYIFNFFKAMFTVKVTNVINGESKPVEPFSWKKLWTGMVNIVNPVAWAKDIQSIFNLRKLVIVGIILSVLYGFGFWKGTQGKPVYLDLEGKEEYIKLNEHFMHVLPNGTVDILAKDRKTILKRLTVKDVEGLQKVLKPYGLQFKPIAVAGVGMGTSGIGVEGGAGISFAKWMDWEADTFVTNRGAYIGASYSLGKFKMPNTSVGLAGGLGWRGDTRVLAYGAIKL